MRASIYTRVALVIAAVATTVATLAGCSSTTGGKAVCPGCGTNAEPSFPTQRPSVSTPTTTPGPESPTPGATETTPPGSGSGGTLPTDADGFVFIETKSGKTRCQLNNDYVGCESDFENAPEIDGSPANGVKVTAGGDLSWVLGNLGDIPVTTLDYGTYSAAGWTIAADDSGTRFTNDSTGHGMFVATGGVESF